MNILNFEKQFINKSYLTISVFGISYKLVIKYTPSNLIKLTKKGNEFILIMPKKYKNSDKVAIINQAIQKLYSEIAKTDLEYSLELVRHILKFAPEDYKIERLSNEYYKISRTKTLIINPDIVQYSKEIINTTLIQAFCKIKFKSNTKAYKENIKSALYYYEEYKNSHKTQVFMAG